jgi:hypothetical protein
MVFRREIGDYDFEKRTTEVMAVSDFDTNIIRVFGKRKPLQR